MNLPPDAYIQTILKNKDSLFYFKHDGTGDQKHPTLVVGITDEDEFIFVMGTSHAQRRIDAITREGLPQHTVVTCYNADCDKLNKKKETAFDCNEIFICHHDTFKQKIVQGELGSIGTLAHDKVEKIRFGIQDSPKIEPIYKEFIKEFFAE